MKYNNPKKILATYLICPPFDNTCSNKDLVGGFRLKSDLSLLDKSSKNLTLMFSKDDDVVPVSHAEKYRNKLDNAKIIIYKSKNGHFNISRFPEIIKMKVQLIILGSGEKHYEKMFTNLVKKYPRKAAVYLGYNHELAHLIEAGADMFLMPSHYEPCGLNQIYSLKYGTVPIVRKTGGLADTVKDWNESVTEENNNGTGFVFEDYSGLALLKSVKRAIRVFHKKSDWKMIMKNGMKCDYSWQKSADKYLELYKKLLRK